MSSPCAGPVAGSVKKRPWGSVSVRSVAPVGCSVVASCVRARGEKSERQPPIPGSARPGSARKPKVAPDGTFPERRSIGVGLAGSFWRAVQHRHELLEVLRQHVRRRDGERRFVLLAEEECRAVGDREHCETEARDEERGGDRGMPGVARERCGGEAQRERPAAPGATERAERGREHACGDDGAREHDQGRDEQQERARPAAPCQLRSADGAARPTDEHDRDRADRRHVERCQGQASELHRRRAHRGVQERAGGCGDDHRGEDAGGREQSMRDDVTGGRAGARGDDRSYGTAGDPTHDRAERGDRRRLGKCEELDLPSARPEPRQSPPRVRHVTS